VILRICVLSKIKSYVDSVVGRWGITYYIRGDEYVGKSIKNYGEYNPDETENIIKLAKEAGQDAWILDVGANIGVISQALSASGFHNVLAFEPQKEVFDILELNCPGVTCFNVAVGNIDGEVFIPMLDFHKHGNFGGVSVSGNSETSSKKVDLITLDGMPELAGCRVGLIKIDVEGYEEKVLVGAMDIILRDKPIIYLEADRMDKLESLAVTLKLLGYSYKVHNPPLYREKNYFNKKRNVWDRNYASYNWECRPYE
jgi:FkbM family methyltransferase